MYLKKMTALSKLPCFAFDFAAKLLHLLTLLTILTHAEERSILEGATVANKDDFQVFA